MDMLSAIRDLFNTEKKLWGQAQRQEHMRKLLQQNDNDLARRFEEGRAMKKKRWSCGQLSDREAIKLDYDADYDANFIFSHSIGKSFATLPGCSQIFENRIKKKKNGLGVPIGLQLLTVLRKFKKLHIKK